MKAGEYDPKFDPKTEDAAAFYIESLLDSILSCDIKISHLLREIEVLECDQVSSKARIRYLREFEKKMGWNQ